MIPVLGELSAQRRTQADIHSKAWGRGSSQHHKSQERHLVQTEGQSPRFSKGCHVRVLKGSQSVEHRERVSFRQKEPNQAQGPKEIPNISPEG